MAMADLIPTGRTSLVKRGKLALQVQTEYAHRPVPRITTTVQKSGQVIQKIERGLDRPIGSIEEKNLLEDRIRKQHAEIVAIIRKNKSLIGPPAGRLNSADRVTLETDPVPLGGSLPPIDSLPPEQAFPGNDIATMDESQIPDDEIATPEDLPLPEDEIATPEDLPKPEEDLSGLTTFERLERLPGRHRIFRLDSEGNFVNASLSRDFKRTFGTVLKNLRELISVFTEIPGVGFARERGVYEIERLELYLLSAGTELFLVYLEDPDYSVDYDELLHKALNPGS
jgi:hypothetical protein